MRLFPRSLFGRLVLVLAGGLVVAQLLSALINFAERDRLMSRSSGMQTAQRIADIVRLLETLDAAERSRIVALLDVPPLRVSIADKPSPEAEKEPDAEGRDAAFANMLGTLLRESRPVRILRAEHRGPGHGARRFAQGAMPGAEPILPRGPGFGMGRPGHGLALVAQVQLRDGAWITFDSYLVPAPEDLPERLLLSLLVLLGGVLIVSVVAVRWATRPLKVLAAAADELGRDIHRPPLPESGPLEVTRAARAFNTMQTRLRQFIDERVRILAAVSHDLKTPITRMRLRAEMLDDEALRNKFEQDLGDMETMVTRTLEFLRGAAGGETARPVDIAALLESLQDDLREMGHDVTVEGQAAAPLIARPQQIKRCIANLLENAVRYGGQAMIAVEDDEGALRIRIRDRGPGIPEQDLERVFEPYHRLESSRSRDTGGTGLGLGIARNIAREHGGDVVLRNCEGGGLEAVLTLSRLRQAAST
jgi:signal transduction histidine kinase